jgi:hypothetical protein
MPESKKEAVQKATKPKASENSGEPPLNLGIPYSTVDYEYTLTSDDLDADGKRRPNPGSLWSMWST